MHPEGESVGYPPPRRGGIAFLLGGGGCDVEFRGPWGISYSVRRMATKRSSAFQASIECIHSKNPG